MVDILVVEVERARLGAGEEVGGEGSGEYGGFIAGFEEDEVAGALEGPFGGRRGRAFLRSFGSNRPLVDCDKLRHRGAEGLDVEGEVALNGFNDEDFDGGGVDEGAVKDVISLLEGVVVGFEVHVDQ